MKTPKKCDDSLPVIKVVQETKVSCYDWELEMDDDTFALMVKWGKEEATDQDFVNIALKAGIEHLINKEDEGCETR
jgi:hypothetical protein